MEDCWAQNFKLFTWGRLRDKGARLPALEGRAYVLSFSSFFSNPVSNTQKAFFPQIPGIVSNFVQPWLNDQRRLRWSPPKSLWLFSCHCCHCCVDGPEIPTGKITCEQPGSKTTDPEGTWEQPLEMADVSLAQALLKVSIQFPAWVGFLTKRCGVITCNYYQVGTAACCVNNDEPS